MNKHTELTEDDLGLILMDSDNQQGFVTRDVESADMVCDGIERGQKTYHMENIVYTDPYIKPIVEDFNMDDDWLVLGRAVGTDMRNNN